MDTTKFDRLLRTIKPYTNKISSFYYHLPQRNRKWLTILVSLTLILILLPNGSSKTETKHQENTGVRQTVPLSLPITESEASSSKHITQKETFSQKIQGEIQEEHQKKIKQHIIPIEGVNITPSTRSPTANTANKVIDKTVLKDGKWYRYQIKKGDTLSKIFRRYNLPITDLYAISAVEGAGKPLNHIHPNQWIQYKKSSDNHLNGLLLELENGKKISYYRLSNGRFIRKN